LLATAPLVAPLVRNGVNQRVALKSVSQRPGRPRRTTQQRRAVDLQSLASAQAARWGQLPDSRSPVRLRFGGDFTSWWMMPLPGWPHLDRLALFGCRAAGFAAASRGEHG